ncbi:MULTISPECIES: DUF1127 domain-containing protein [unclassified Yoonia]|uniref:DUF1127 domain-containing protein n=1 Tax=unclassified Yoonia TaxID=2629118 RepID=UPI002AFF4665|nr:MULTISPECIES: DUF1127 domain-containing protein [unclassified Yoonia]
MTTDTHSCAITPSPKRLSLVSLIMHALTLTRQRRRLQDLDPHLLDDIGITQQQAAAEAEKPLWDVPRHWRM